MAKRRYFSHSRLSSYEQCPRKYCYRYLDDIPRYRRNSETGELEIVADGESIEAFTGHLVHSVLQWCYEEVQAGRTPAESGLQAEFARLWKAGYDPDRIEKVKAERTVDSYREMGERCIASYHHRHAPFDRGERHWLEVKLTAPLDPGQQFWVIGYADRITQHADGVFEIRDYKTGRWVPTQDELDRDRQLALYRIAFEHMVRRGEEGFEDAGTIRDVVLAWSYLQTDAERTSRRTAAQLTRLQRATVSLASQIVAREGLAEPTTNTEAAQRAAADVANAQFPTTTDPKSKRLCNWCDYRLICPDEEGSAEIERTARSAARVARAEREATTQLAKAAKAAGVQDGQGHFGFM